MYIPKHYHWSLPVIVLMIGFYIGEHYAPGFDVYFVQICLGFVACTHALYIWQAGVIYQRWQAGEPEPQPKQNQVIKTNFNSGVMVMEQVVLAPVEDKVRQFANILIHQKKMERVDLREKFWNKHFGSRENWVNVRDWLAKKNAINRTGDRKNASYTVSDWRVIELLARGEKLS